MNRRGGEQGYTEGINLGQGGACWGGPYKTILFIGKRPVGEGRGQGREEGRAKDAAKKKFPENDEERAKNEVGEWGLNIGGTSW